MILHYQSSQPLFFPKISFSIGYTFRYVCLKDEREREREREREDLASPKNRKNISVCEAQWKGVGIEQPEIYFEINFLLSIPSLSLSLSLSHFVWAMLATAKVT